MFNEAFYYNEIWVILKKFWHSYGFIKKNIDLVEIVGKRGKQILLLNYNVLKTVG